MGKVKEFGNGWCIPHRMAADNAKGESVRTPLLTSNRVIGEKRFLQLSGTQVLSPECQHFCITLKLFTKRRRSDFG